MNLHETLGRYTAIAIIVEENPNFYTREELVQRLVSIKNDELVG